MAKAFKCDKCDEVFAGAPPFQALEHIIDFAPYDPMGYGGHLRFYAKVDIAVITKEQDFCGDCLHDMVCEIFEKEKEE